MWTGTSHLWSLMVFAYHQFRSNGVPSDGLFRQQQAILRTVPTPSSLMADATKLWWSWRRATSNALVRSLTQFAFATLCTLAFLSASIFSSYIVSSSDIEVLVSSHSCGPINPKIPLNPWRVHVAALSSIATSYAQECYQEQKILPARCKTFVRPNIPFTVQNSSCPFASEVCIGNVSAVSMDSGLVDLNDGFGLNLPDSERVSYGRKTTCAVLSLPGHTSIVDATAFSKELLDRSPFPGEQIEIMSYGTSAANPTGWENVTVFSSLLGAKFQHTYVLKYVASYTLK
jgi:hypothetical protein